ncbi:hypothetical protein GCM10011519_33690 [Marmoricola endophyticus]|uniref:Uncharacterized protein n=1 Tax=Marmoricola endophyticus TaxID=2040280 RepID=A0A917F8P8_9ACTN|nr:hypothetical protein GCM10011519_33690 [Marmoricola endophyticus]
MTGPGIRPASDYIVNSPTGRDRRARTGARRIGRSGKAAHRPRFDPADPVGSTLDAISSQAARQREGADEE